MRIGCATILATCSFVALLGDNSALAQDAPGAERIPGTQITALEQEFAQGMRGTSVVKIRRACKSVARKSAALLEASPGAPNRYAVLAIRLKGQLRLLGLENRAEIRAATFETCRKLMDAPDEYAEARCEAEILLSERDLGAADATVEERVEALEKIVARYRGTPAGLRSLTIASHIASELQAFDLQERIYKELAGRSFGGNHKAIAIRRKAHTVSRLDAVFSGTYDSVDGASVTFPFDRLGHQYLVIFWSKDPDGHEGHEAFLSRIREQQERFPGRFEVYSFNLDELPDAGQGILTEAGVKCSAMHLPGGRSSSAYRAYGLMDPLAILVNAQGHMWIQWGVSVPWPRPTPARGKEPANPGPGLGMWLDDDRYLAQLRSLFIGDFLIANPHPASSLQAIRSCFTPAPYRYRLTQKESLANYRRAEKLCDAAIKKAPNASGLWAVRNCRIISLLGMWNLSREPQYLDEAVKEAKTTLAAELPPGKDVVARFCLAKDALRRGDTYPESLLSDFVDAESGAKAPVAALAAAAILAIESNAETLYQEYRRRFLSDCDEDDPTLWSVLSFMRDRHHDYRLFWGNPGRWGYTRKQRYKVRHLISGFGAHRETHRVLVAVSRLAVQVEIPDRILC